MTSEEKDSTETMADGELISAFGDGKIPIGRPIKHNMEATIKKKEDSIGFEDWRENIQNICVVLIYLLNQLLD